MEKEVEKGLIQPFRYQILEGYSFYYHYFMRRMNHYAGTEAPAV
jgi:spermidine/putrescine-binding protein